MILQNSVAPVNFVCFWFGFYWIFFPLSRRNLNVQDVYQMFKMHHEFAEWRIQQYSHTCSFDSYTSFQYPAKVNELKGSGKLLATWALKLDGKASFLCHHFTVISWCPRNTFFQANWG